MKTWMPEDAEVVRWIRVEAGRSALAALGRTLRPHGIEILVIKGAYLELIANEPFRAMDDVDALVVTGSFSEAIRVARDSQLFDLEGEGWSAQCMRHRKSGVMIDLHRLPLPPAFGHVSKARLRTRASDTSKIGDALVPDALDAAALSIGNFVKDSVGNSGHGQLAGDLRRLIAYRTFNPTELAERLTELGLRRVGLVAFTAMTRSDPTWQPWAHACVAMSMDAPLARWIVLTMDRLCAAGRYDLSFLLARSISDRIIPDSALGFSLTTARFARDRIRGLRDRMKV